MKITEMDSWAKNHFDYFLDAVRIYLGIGLLIKGYSLLSHPEALAGLNETGLASLVPATPYMHMIGGMLLAVGLFPRLAALVNIPILFGATFFIHGPRMNTLAGREGFEFSGLVLFLLGLIAIRGAGPLSIAALWRRAPAERVGHSLQRWADEHPDVFADLVRIYLGVGLFVKGIYIMGHREEIIAMLGGTNFSIGMMAAAHYVIPAHLAGGALLVCGLLTRWAAAAQIPPLIGALFYVFLPRFTALEMRQSLEFTALVLFLLILITVFGAGRLSVERAGRKDWAYRPSLQPIH
jgi:uncharacterized membrane protein YphA (DoxX/SURF4 family)